METAATIITVPRREMVRRVVTAEIRFNEQQYDNSRALGKLLLCMNEVGVKAGGLPTQSLASDLANRLDLAMLQGQRKVSAYLNLLHEDTWKYLVRHLNDQSEGDPTEELNVVLEKAKTVEEQVESFAGQLLDDLAYAAQSVSMREIPG